MSVKLSLAGGATAAAGSRVRANLRQTLVVIIINIPTLSFGLATGWVSLVTGEGGDGGAGAEPVVAAALTFCAALVGMPLCARALVLGRRVPLIATSALFTACWCLKLCGGGWWVVGARVCAGVGGAGAWMLAPLIAKEMCEERYCGAAVSALVVANNAGVVLMYISALLQLTHRVVLCSCIVLSVVHCCSVLLLPDSPQYLAATGQTHEARLSLAWLRGVEPDDNSVSVELMQYNAKEQTAHAHASLIAHIKDMLSDSGRRAAFVMSCVVVMGQELSGVVALMHYAERVFVVARGEGVGQVEGAPPTTAPRDTLTTPAAHALLLGVAQLVASFVALYLIERVGRKRLIVFCAVVTGVSLALAACLVRWGGAGAAPWAAAALAVTVFADSAGLEPASYAMVTDMFEYEYRGCALMLVDALTWFGNAVEVSMFPVLVLRCGLTAVFALSATVTLSLAVYSILYVPETRARCTADIYDELLHRASAPAPASPPHYVTHL